MTSQLSEVLVQMSRDSEKHRDSFYHTLFHAELAVPLSPEQDKMKQGNLSLQLALDDDGSLVFIAFSSETYLQRWVEQDTPYSLLPAKDVIEIATKDKSKLILDPAGPHIYEFSVEELQSLVEYFSGHHHDIEFFEPEIDTTELAEQLTLEFSQYPKVKEAYLVQLGDDQKKILLGLYFGEMDALQAKKEFEKLEIILNNLNIIEKYSIQIIDLSEPDLLVAMSDAVEAFYMKY